MLINILKHLRKKIDEGLDTTKSDESRKWRLWQIEPSVACNLGCIMCPWVDARKKATSKGLMSEEIWEALLPHLNDVTCIDFTGGGEPLLQKHLLKWIMQAKNAGCNVGFLSNGLLLNKIISDKLRDIGLDWIGFSIDGADQQTYEHIRCGSDFNKICANIEYFTGCRSDKRPLVMINFVLMTLNFHQVEDIIELAERLGADQVNFKQCDVIRGERGKPFGLFGADESKQVRVQQQTLNKALRLARRRNIKTTSYSFVPVERPVCDQDPRDSLFIGYDGTVSPCINLAIDGPSMFLGEEVYFPDLSYGKIPYAGVFDLWESEHCRSFRMSFEQRVRKHDSTLATADLGHDLIKFKEALHDAIKAMPEAHEGCRTCHYLYGV